VTKDYSVVGAYGDGTVALYGGAVYASYKGGDI